MTALADLCPLCARQRSACACPTTSEARLAPAPHPPTERRCPACSSTHYHVCAGQALFRLADGSVCPAWYLTGVAAVRLLDAADSAPTSCPRCTELLEEVRLLRAERERLLAVAVAAEAFWDAETGAMRPSVLDPLRRELAQALADVGDLLSASRKDPHV